MEYRLQEGTLLFKIKDSSLLLLKLKHYDKDALHLHWVSAKTNTAECQIQAGSVMPNILIHTTYSTFQLNKLIESGYTEYNKELW